MKTFKKFRKKTKMRFLNSVTAEKCKRGAILLQNMEPNEGGPFDAVQNLK